MIFNVMYFFELNKMLNVSNYCHFSPFPRLQSIGNYIFKYVRSFYFVGQYDTM